MSEPTKTIEVAPPAPRAPQTRAPRQGPAFWAMTWASLRAQTRNISTLIFGFAFPLAFIAIFGLIGSGSSSVKLGVVEGADTTSPVYQALAHISVVTLSTGSQDALTAKLKHGDIDGIVTITTTPGTGQVPGYNVTLATSSGSPASSGSAIALMQGVIDQANLRLSGVTSPPVTLTQQQIGGHVANYIDFALPGQLGFSLLSIAVFGTAFGFVVLKRTLVLKRIFATPTRPTTIVLAQGTSRLIIAVAQTLVLLLAGVFLFKFYLANGAVTLLTMLLVSIFGLIVFLGFGLVIAGNFNDENAMGPVINLVTLPQFLLAGTFFSTSNFPGWLQPIANNLPLSYLNVALRDIASDGASLYDVRWQLLGLLVWGVLTYAIAIRTFKWE